MLAEVSSIQFGAMKGSSEREEPTALITRDLLGACCSTNTLGSTELELKSHVKSGILYPQKCNLPRVGDGNELELFLNQIAKKSVDLKLAPSTNTNHQCTLDKVKSALERAEKKAETKKRSPNCSDFYSLSLTQETEMNCDEESMPLTFATGCPNCLLYALVSVKNPKCPRCNTTIAPLFAAKKPRLDLNMKI